MTLWGSANNIDAPEARDLGSWVARSAAIGVADAGRTVERAALRRLDELEKDLFLLASMEPVVKNGGSGG